MFRFSLREIVGKLVCQVDSSLLVSLVLLLVTFLSLYTFMVQVLPAGELVCQVDSSLLVSLILLLVTSFSL